MQFMSLTHLFLGSTSVVGKFAEQWAIFMGLLHVAEIKVAMLMLSCYSSVLKGARGIASLVIDKGKGLVVTSWFLKM